MGCSIYGRRRLALVQKQGGIYMAAEYLLDFYSALRILCAFFFQTPEKRPGSIRSRSAGDARHQPGPARGSRHLWRTDTDRILHAAVCIFKGRGWAHNKQHKGSVGSSACLGSAFHSFQGRQFRCDRERHALQDFSADPFLGSFNAAVFI